MPTTGAVPDASDLAVAGGHRVKSIGCPIQIANELKTALKTEHVAVVIDALHLCVASRGVEDITSSTVTSKFFGKFEEDTFKQEFLNHIYHPRSKL